MNAEKHLELKLLLKQTRAFLRGKLIPPLLLILNKLECIDKQAKLELFIDAAPSVSLVSVKTKKKTTRL